MNSKFNSLATLSVVALFAASAALAQEAVPAPAPAEAIPQAAPEPVAAPAPAVPVATPVVTPIAAALPEPPPVTKPAESAITIAGTKVSLYGFLQLNAVYEDGANGGKNWSTWAEKNAEDGEGRLLLNVNHTRIGINVTGPSKESGAELSGKFESDFLNKSDRYPNGNGGDKGAGFRIRHSYGQLKFNDIGLSLLIGQTQDLIAPLTAPSLNQGALQGEGSLGTRRPQIRLTQALGPIEIAAAATDNRDATSPILPAFQGSIKAKLPAKAEFILSGHYASAEVAAEDEAGVKAKEAKGYKEPPASWSGVASLSLPIISSINLSGELFYGQNLANYNTGSIGQSGVTTKSGDGLQSLGGWGAANIKISPSFALAGGYGVEALDEDREPVTGRIKNSVIFANLKFFVDETAFIGFEYANLATDYVDNTSKRKTDDGKLNRFELVFNYAFK